jgi:glycosyltransferase involved in cell wall biosynthesis
MNKIAIITPFLAQGGLEKVAVTGAEYLKEHFDTTLIVFDTFKVDYEYSGEMIDLKVPLYGLNPLMKMLSLIKIVKKLKKLQGHEKYDLLVVHGELANLSTLFNSFNKKIIVIHENRFAKKSSKLKNAIFNVLAKAIYNSKSTTKLITVSEGIRESFIANFELSLDKIQTIYNPYNIKTIQDLSQQNIPDDYSTLFHNHDVFLIAARLSEQKGHKHFLQIFKYHLSNSNNVNSKLVLFGDGELRSEVIEIAKEMKLKTYSIFDNDKYEDSYDVYFLGFDKNPYKYMRNSKLFIMSSLWEGFGNTLVESMASGTPVISTDCKSGPKEILSHKIHEDILDIHYGDYGILMPRIDGQDTDEIKCKMWNEAINNIIKNDALYNKYAERGEVRANDFDVGIIMKQWKSLIENQFIEY